MSCMTKRPENHCIPLEVPMEAREVLTKYTIKSITKDNQKMNHAEMLMRIFSALFFRWQVGVVFAHKSMAVKILSCKLLKISGIDQSL